MTIWYSSCLSLKAEPLLSEFFIIFINTVSGGEFVTSGVKLW